MRLMLPIACLFLAVGVACAAPVIYWASDPVAPGETVLVAGSGFGEKPLVGVARVTDASATTLLQPPSPPKYAPVEALQPTDTGLKFVLPASLKPGQYTFSVQNGKDMAVGLLNRPAIWWMRGDLGADAVPGGTLRVLGRNLLAPGQKTTVCLEGSQTRMVAATSDGYSASLTLPANLPPGNYKVSVHNGLGMWSEAQPLVVVARPPQPSTILNVRDFGADGTGARDDTTAVQTALNKAGESGGVVLLPRGRYLISDTLRIPPKVTLRGEKRELVALFWPDFPNPPEALLLGTNSFAIEDLTVYASHHKHVIASDLGRTPNAGNVRLHRVRVRADSYRGHIKPEEVDERFRLSLKWSTGGGDTVRLGGENLEVTECDLYGSGRSLFLSRARHSLVANNQLYNGRWGWYCLEGSDGLIFEHNLLQGGDLMSTGGGIANYSTAFSRNIYYSYNEMKLTHGWDREVMTTDAGGEAYFGGVAASNGAQMTLAQDARWGSRDWSNGGVFILDGTGAGQWRFIKAWNGREVTLDRPWQVQPDATSVLGITMFHGRYAFVGNNLSDCGAFQFYGTSIECDVVNNTAARNQGFQALGLWYHGFQPSWYCQFLGNTITEGNYYHWTSATDSVINVFGAARAEYKGPLTRGAVVRGNKLLANSLIRVAGTCANALVAQNRVEQSNTGIFVSQGCRDVLLRDNQFANVLHELQDEPGMRKAAQERLARYLNRPDPVLAYEFDEATDGTIRDASGNGFTGRLEGVKLVDGGVTGKAAQFDGTGYVRVNEPAVFNAPDLTVDFMVKPANLRGRRGLVVKRWANAAAPWVISQNGSAISFEATDEQGKWSFNFSTPGVLKENVWTRVTVVMKTGEGVRVYADGKQVAARQNPLGRIGESMEPLILGREAWGGDPPNTGGPGLFIGLLDHLRIWTRALTDTEVAGLQ